MALLEMRNGDWLRAVVRAEAVSSPPRSLSRESSAYADAQGDDEATEEA